MLYRILWEHINTKEYFALYNEKILSKMQILTMGRTMIIGVMSDTHDNIDGIEKAIERLNAAGADVIIHLGDFVSPFSLKKVAEINRARKVYAVFGNNDGDKLLLRAIANEKGVIIEEQPLEVTLDGSRFLLIHGIGDENKTIRFATALAKSREYDAVFFGHTHHPFLDYINGVLLLNPGEVAGIFTRPSIALVSIPSMAARILEI